MPSYSEHNDNLVDINEVRRQRQAPTVYDHEDPETYRPPQATSFVDIQSLPKRNRKPGVFEGFRNLSSFKKTMLGLGTLASMVALSEGPAIGRQIEGAVRATEDFIAPIPKPDKPHLIVKHNVRVAGDTEFVRSDYKGNNNQAPAGSK